jgi:hypothetical protein
VLYDFAVKFIKLFQFKCRWYCWQHRFVYWLLVYLTREFRWYIWAMNMDIQKGETTIPTVMIIMWSPYLQEFFNAHPTILSIPLTYPQFFCSIIIFDGIKRKNPHQTSTDSAVFWPSSASKYFLHSSWTLAFFACSNAVILQGMWIAWLRWLPNIREAAVAWSFSCNTRLVWKQPFCGFYPGMILCF